ITAAETFRKRVTEYGHERQGLYALSAEDHQALLQQSGYDPMPTPGRARDGVVLGGGEETGPRLGSRRRRHAEARTSASADRSSRQASQSGPDRGSRQGIGASPM